jgi:hypothetical protein
MKNRLEDSPGALGTIQKTIFTGRLFEGFWDRWIAHGMIKNQTEEFRQQVNNLDDWISLLKLRADTYEQKASYFHEQLMRQDAEYFYRLAGLHHNLIQWVFPGAGQEKRMWLASCRDLFDHADALTDDNISKVVMHVDQIPCHGRIRVPECPKGCVIILNPIDSNKEELFTYEMDFAGKGFVTVSFDGPGQGETYVFNGHKATRSNWSQFVKKAIDYAAVKFPDLDLYLFGTSSGAAWAIEGSSHPKVRKAVSVSPACESDVKIPDYFLERMSHILEDPQNGLLPELCDFERFSPILLFHGNKDVMVKDEDIYELYRKLPQGKKLIEFVEEGHCCNYKLAEVRKLSAEWFLEERV